ncbi:MAG: hypothetical protein K2J10_04360 [Muribaculaceae bacterium]|nr:hypothetical protein [Muribaculaceae bacterium]
MKYLLSISSYCCSLHSHRAKDCDIISDGTLEYSAFGGGYFDPDKGTMYYVTDWQGNNAAVVDKDGIVVQRTMYYPYGEPTIEPTGQRYLFGGKEREHAGGRNSYDFGARCLAPYGSWGVVDQMAEKFYPISPYSYCVGDPINHIDKDGYVAMAIPLIKGFCGAGTDFLTQMSVNLGTGQSFLDAVWNIDLTSVLTSGLTSAMLVPGASLGTKAAAIAINVGDAVVDVKLSGITYVGGEEDETKKTWLDALIDLAASVIPWMVEHQTIHLPESPVKSYYGEGAAKTFTKEEMERATTIIFKVSGEGLKINLKDSLKINIKTESTDAIKPKQIPLPLDFSNPREYLTQEELHLQLK